MPAATVPALAAASSSRRWRRVLAGENDHRWAAVPLSEYSCRRGAVGGRRAGQVHRQRVGQRAHQADARAVAHGDPLLGPRAVGRPQLQPGARAGVGGGHVERQAAGGVAHGHVAAAGVLPTTHAWASVPLAEYSWAAVPSAVPAPAASRTCEEPSAEATE